MYKNIIKVSIVTVSILFIVFSVVILLKKESTVSSSVVLSETFKLSNEYVSLRLKTDNVLINAKDYPNYDIWNKDMESTINGWDKLVADSAALEKMSKNLEGNKLGLSFINSAYAYDKQEISNIFDNAPAGKKIATLAKHLGVDAKRAFKILQQDQAQLEADGWNEAGDTFRKLEVSAIVIKDGCKIAGFAGGIILTGGAAGLATASTLSNATVVIGGADLVLEVTDDAASIALGDNNKISYISNKARKITEPISTLLTINEIPNNLKNGYEKFTSTMVAIDQFRGVAQDGKIIGIEIPVYTKDKEKRKVGVSVMSKEEIQSWIDSRGRLEEPKKIALKEVKDDVVVGTSSPVQTDNLYIGSPEGKSFKPESNLSFSADLRNPQSIMSEGKNQPVWCNWRFYLNNELHTTKIVPSIVHANSKSVCGYSTQIIKGKGKLRVEFNLEKSQKSKYSDEKNIETLLKTVREYEVL